VTPCIRRSSRRIDGLSVDSVGVLILNDDGVPMLGTTARDILGDEC
jgi:hypothetical protein